MRVTLLPSLLSRPLLVYSLLSCHPFSTFCLLSLLYFLVRCALFVVEVALVAERAFPAPESKARLQRLLLLLFLFVFWRILMTCLM
jgi:hypothetical protein